MGVPQPKSTHGFSPNFQDMFTEEDPELIRCFSFVYVFFFFGGGGGGGGGVSDNCFHGNTLS